MTWKNKPHDILMFLINFVADFTKLKTKLKNIKYIEIKLTSNSGLLEFLFLKKKKKTNKMITMTVLPDVTGKVHPSTH